MVDERRDTTRVTSDQTAATVRLAAVGDMLLSSPPNGEDVRNAADVFASVESILDECDIVFGNLECTLPGSGETIPTEPRVISTPEVVRSIHLAGFNVVTLANNHVFDCLQEGFCATRRLVAEMGIYHFGAGDNLADATAPTVLERKGIRVAFLAAVDERSRPFRFAGSEQWGVAPFDVEELLRRIRGLRDEVDHVIVSPHWGEERFLVPSPVQIEQARAFVDAGASMVLGHHSHVIQGLEIYKGAPIIYSLGNFIANDVYLANGDVMRWNRIERTGCILMAELTRKSVISVRQVATIDTGRRIKLDRTGFGDRRIARANRALAKGITPRRYRREYLWVKTISPAFDHLRMSKLKHLRLRHFRNGLASLFRADKLA